MKQLGYFTYSKTTGYYGNITVRAVKCFQRDNNITADGIVGKRTFEAINKVKGSKLTTTSKSALKNTATIKSVSGTALMSSNDPLPEYSGDFDWFKEVKYIWDRGENATVTDVDTGKSFEVKRTYGSNHADVEPLTKADTLIIKDIWGGFSWERRAVVVQIGKYTIAASMTAMPHAGLDSVRAGKYVSNRSAGYGRGYNFDAIKNNGASGVMDIHFKNSRTHSTNRLQSSQQNMVQKAEDYIDKLLNRG